jgi:Zn-dependent protease with chaperone function
VNPPLLLIPLAIEWVILVTTLAPIVLVGRFTNRANLGIAIWFATFLSAGFATLIAIGVAVWGYFQTVESLNYSEFGSHTWWLEFLFSFAPWIALALGGVTLALVNQRLEPMLQTAKDVKPLLTLSKVPFLNFHGVSVSTVELPFAYALATGKEILLSRFVISHLSNTELDAVLWHEFYHVRRNHFWIKRLARLIRLLSPRLAASSALVSEVEKLIEISADAFAITNTDRQTVEMARKLFS